MYSAASISASAVTAGALGAAVVGLLFLVGQLEELCPVQLQMRHLTVEVVALVEGVMAHCDSSLVSTSTAAANARTS